MNKKKPILFTTLGYPGSGKTYFAEKFAKEFNLFHLNSDKVRLEIFPDPKRTPEEHEIVYRLMDYIAEEFLKKGIGVIYDANMTKIEFRRRLMDLAKKCSANYLLLWFQTPEELAIERIKKRSNFKSESFKKFHVPTTENAVYKIKSEQEHPTTEQFVIIDGRNLYKEQVKELRKSLLI